MLRQLNARTARRVLHCGAAAVALLAAAPAFAQAPDSAVTLVMMLIKDGTITPERGVELLRRADGSSAGAASSAATQRALPPAVAPDIIATAPREAGSSSSTAPNGSIRVPYIPEPVRDQIRDEIRADVMAQARREGWASADSAAPSWVKNFTIHGDMRFRSFSTFYSQNNSPLITDTSKWNLVGPIDLLDQGRTPIPVLNATNDRLNQAQLRARLFMKAEVADHFEVGVQLATGDNNGPVSTNSFLGGGFAKRDIWLQNAYLKGDFYPGVTATIGRFDNPLRTTDLMFDPDLAFDGVYGEIDVAKVLGYPNYTLAVRGGAFPIDFGDPDFPTEDFNKRNFRDRYLYSVQGELGAKFDGGVDVRLDGAYHDFTYLRGHTSDPCDVYASPGLQCSTDALAPAFMSKGNTYMFLRQFDLTNQNGPLQAPQLIGYKFAYRVFDVSGSISAPVPGDNVVRLTGNYLHNFGFDPENICKEGEDAQPQNNVVGGVAGVCHVDPDPKVKNTSVFRGGDDAWGVTMALGKPHLFRVNAFSAKRGDWAVVGGYKYIESDAVPDAFTDSDFHLGGTNAKGYWLQATYAPFNNITLGARWYSANEITDQPLSIDVLHLDLAVAF